MSRLPVPIRHLPKLLLLALLTILAACAGPPPAQPTNPSGTLVLELTPSNASVSIKGPVEKTLTGSQSLELPAGNYEIALSAEGHDQEQIALEVKAGEYLRLERVLEANRTYFVVIEPDTTDTVSGDNSTLFNTQNTPTYGPEIVINGKFENRLTNWTTITGTPSMVTRSSGLAVNLRNARIEQTLDPSQIVGGGEYRLQTLGRFTSGICQVGLLARIGNTIGLNQAIPFTSSNWTQKSISFTIPADTTALVVYAEGGTCRYDDISLMRNTAFNPQPPAQTVTVAYLESGESIVNPERGFRSGWQLGHIQGSTNLAFVDLPAQRVKGYSMIQAYVSLQNYKNRSIDSTYLNSLRVRMQDVVALLV
jgi:hypothetical protein